MLETSQVEPFLSPSFFSVTVHREDHKEKSMNLDFNTKLLYTLAKQE